MILWHVGITLLIVRYVFRDPSMDLRWVALGSILPDLIDKPIGSVLFHQTFQAHRIYGHTLLFPVVSLVAVMALTRRGTPVRKALIGVVLGVFVHLILDGVWVSPDTFLWPLFGFGFPKVAGSDFPTLISAMVTSPWVWLGEALGAAYLVYLWRRHLSARGELRRFAAEGTIPLRTAS